MSTEWRLFKTLVNQNKRWLVPNICLKQVNVCCDDLMSVSSARDGVHNRRGRVFKFQDYKALLTQDFREELEPEDVGYMNFAEYLSYLFVALSFLLGALRSIQFNLFRKAGLRHCEFDRDNIDANGNRSPMATVLYTQIDFDPPPKTRTNPINMQDECTSEQRGGMQPLRTRRTKTFP